MVHRLDSQGTNSIHIARLRRAQPCLDFCCSKIPLRAQDPFCVLLCPGTPPPSTCTKRMTISLAIKDSGEELGPSMYILRPPIWFRRSDGFEAWRHHPVIMRYSPNINPSSLLGLSIDPEIMSLHLLSLASPPLISKAGTRASSVTWGRGREGTREDGSKDPPPSQAGLGFPGGKAATPGGSATPGPREGTVHQQVGTQLLGQKQW